MGCKESARSRLVVPLPAEVSENMNKMGSDPAGQPNLFT